MSAFRPRLAAAALVGLFAAGSAHAQTGSMPIPTGSPNDPATILWLVRQGVPREILFPTTPAQAAYRAELMRRMQGSVLRGAGGAVMRMGGDMNAPAGATPPFAAPGSALPAFDSTAAQLPPALLPPSSAGSDTLSLDELLRTTPANAATSADPAVRAQDEVTAAAFRPIPPGVRLTPYEAWQRQLTRQAATAAATSAGSPSDLGLPVVPGTSETPPTGNGVPHCRCPSASAPAGPPSPTPAPAPVTPVRP